MIEYSCALVEVGNYTRAAEQIGIAQPALTIAMQKLTLQEISTFLNNHPDMNFYVVGHTDSTGSFSYNSTLSGQRAAALRKALIDVGLQTRGWKPMALAH